MNGTILYYVIVASTRPLTENILSINKELNGKNYDISAYVSRA